MFYRPCMALQPYVRYYWVFGCDRPLSTLTFPTAVSQLIFHRKTPLCVPELGVSQHRLTVSGQVNFPSHLSAVGEVEMVVVVFRPHTAGMFLWHPMSLFYNREVSGCDLEDRGLHELAARVSGCSGRAQCVEMIEEWLVSRLSFLPDDAGRRRCREGAGRNLRRMEAAVERIRVAPQTRVSELAALACLSRKQFERTFDALVGIHPKEYASIVRFHKALSVLRRLAPDELDWARIACACEYADQSHFIRECRRFSGLTPAALLGAEASWSDPFAEPA